MKVVVDIGGCDKPKEFVKGIAIALNQTDAHIIAVGDQALVDDVLQNEQFDRSRLTVVHATEVVTNHDQPAAVINEKPNSSLVVAMNYLREHDDCQIFISAGSTGAILVGSIFIVSRQINAQRPALASLLINAKGTMTCLLDCGANVDCNAGQLVNFAKLGSLFMQKAYDISRPTVYLLSNGSEEGKGNALTKQTYEKLKETQLNFCGNKEASNVLDGSADVIVCDGFSGNVLLKCIEGTAKNIAKQIYQARNLDENLQPGVDKCVDVIKSTYDYSSRGGAILLGINKMIIKAHGSANEQTICYCIKQAEGACKNHFLENSQNI